LPNTPTQSLFFFAYAAKLYWFQDGIGIFSRESVKIFMWQQKYRCYKLFPILACSYFRDLKSLVLYKNDRFTGSHPVLKELAGSLFELS
jgi:hypothetical protein